MTSKYTAINHDTLFKWLISSFFQEFIAHYFPKTRLGSYTILDKQFYKESKDKEGVTNEEADLFLIVEVEIDGVLQDIVVIIEHKSARTDVREQLMKYFCHAWLARGKPVWPIAFFTDDKTWRKPLDHRVWIGITNGERQYLVYDMIKLSEERSADLIRHRSLFCKLLALKANTAGCRRTDLLRAIFDQVAELGDRLDHNKTILIENFVKFYSNLSQKTIEKVRQEAKMAIVAPTILEQYQLIFKENGKKIGQKEGQLKTCRESLATYEAMLADGDITESAFKKLADPISQKIAILEAELASLNESEDDLFMIADRDAR